MKIQVFDINHIIEQIKCASPPTDKDMHKLINNLSILLDKNVTRKHSPLETVLTSNTEKLRETLVDLCFLRKEIVQKFSKEYYEIINEAVLQIKANTEKINTTEKILTPEINWSTRTASQPTEIMSATFSKLHKAKSIIEDALNKNVKTEKNPESIVKAFFQS